MWLNIGVDFSCDVDQYYNNQQLFSFAPLSTTNTYTHTDTVGAEFGASISSKNDASITGNGSFTRSITYSTNDRNIQNTSIVEDDDLFQVSFVYDCFNVDNIPAWQYWLQAYIYTALNPTAGFIWQSMATSFVTHKENYNTFLNTMVEYSTFIVQIPKSQSNFMLNLSCTSNQLYIDYDYINSYNFESVTAAKTITIRNN